MRGVDRLLKPDGLFVSDNQYWLAMVEHGHYDNVFHQHLRNYSLRPLMRLMGQYGLEVCDVERSEVYGGSICVTACRKGRYPASTRLKELVDHEEGFGLYDAATNIRFAAAAAERKKALFDAVFGRVSAGKKVVGIGAPAKASTVCNYCRLGPDLLTYVTEVNPLRIGKFLPGVHVPIVDEAFMFEDPRPADAAVLFAWNYYDEIVPKLRARGYQGEILRP